MKQVDTHIWRGPRPKDIRILRNKGFKRIINLQSGSENNFTESRYETQCHVADLYDIDYLEVPCSNFFPPTVDQVNVVVFFLEDEIKTYIHCHSGVDRTGFMIAAYQMRCLGHSFREAYYEWLKQGRHWWFWWWKSALKKWAK